jgi:hypothetical protein
VCMVMSGVYLDSEGFFLLLCAEMRCGRGPLPNMLQSVLLFWRRMKGERPCIDAVTAALHAAALLAAVTRAFAGLLI